MQYAGNRLYTPVFRSDGATLRLDPGCVDANFFCRKQDSAGLILEANLVCLVISNWQNSIFDYTFIILISASSQLWSSSFFEFVFG